MYKNDNMVIKTSYVMSNNVIGTHFLGCLYFKYVLKILKKTNVFPSFICIGPIICIILDFCVHNVDK